MQRVDYFYTESMFSKATEYALRATIFIAQKGSEENKMGIDDISKAIDSPPSFTAKILQTLTRANIVSASRGPKGGFFISEKGKNLPARKILLAMGEDNVLEKCVLGLKMCSELQPCPMHTQYKAIRVQLKNLFITKTIKQLAAEIKDGVIFINNQPK